MRLPAVLVPLPTAADNHQLFNARAFASDGAARLLEQNAATPEDLVRSLRELVTDDAVRSPMRAALARRHAPTAAAEIATQLLAMLAERATGAVATTRVEVVA